MVDYPHHQNSDDLAKIRTIGRYPEREGLRRGHFGLVPVSGGEQTLRARLAEICAEADAAIEEGASFLILSIGMVLPNAVHSMPFC